jgi:hypothetical protein
VRSISQISLTFRIFPLVFTNSVLPADVPGSLRGCWCCSWRCHMEGGSFGDRAPVYGVRKWRGSRRFCNSR